MKKVCDALRNWDFSQNISLTWSCKDVGAIKGNKALTKKQGKSKCLCPAAQLSAITGDFPADAFFQLQKLFKVSDKIPRRDRLYPYTRYVQDNQDKIENVCEAWMAAVK